jgi:hypothetical protein
MTIQRVRTIYAETGKTLGEDVSVRPSHVRTYGWFSPRKQTGVVWTNTTQRGGNRVFEFDAESGELLKDFVLPR